MKYTLFLAFLTWNSAQARTIGLQYDYLCKNEDGQFNVTITKSNAHKAIQIDGEYVDANKIAIEPRLGNKNIRLYFVGSAEDEQNNICVLTYTNAH